MSDESDEEVSQDKARFRKKTSTCRSKEGGHDAEENAEAVRDVPSDSSSSEGVREETNGDNNGEVNKVTQVQGSVDVADEDEEQYGLNGNEVRDGPFDSSCSEGGKGYFQTNIEGVHEHTLMCW